MFLGVNLLSREGYSQAGDRMRVDDNLLSDSGYKNNSLLDIFNAWTRLALKPREKPCKRDMMPTACLFFSVPWAVVISFT